MANYTPPNILNLPFEFTSSGYSKPAFNDVGFQFSSKSYVTSSLNLQSSIEVMRLYQEDTYTYTKECKTVIVGYSNQGVQTIKLPCVFGGIRDLGTFINPVFTHVDLSAYLGVSSNFLNLNGFIRRVTVEIKNLYGNLKGTTTSSLDLRAVVTGDYEEVNLQSFLNIISVTNLNAALSPTLFKSYGNLNSYLKINIQNNTTLASYLNIIEIRELPVHIVPKFLNGFKDIKMNIRGLGTSFGNLNVFFQGYAERFLNAQINQVYFSDLKGRILSTLDFDLNAFIDIIDPVDLQANLHSYVYTNLMSNIFGGYGPTDLVTHLYAVSPIDLPTSLYAFGGVGVITNLKAYVTSLYESNLYAYLNAGGSYNLLAEITATGSTRDLYSYLFPKVIHIKKVFSITLLSTKNLYSVINSACFKTQFKDLGTKLYSYDNRNLNAYLMVGFHIGGNLPAAINNDTILTMNTVDVSFLPDKKYSRVHANINSAAAGITFDTIQTTYTRVLNWYKGASSLLASLEGTKYFPAHKDLNTYLKAVIDKPFTTGKSSHRLKVLDLEYNGGYNWKREIELLFNAQAKQYRYVAADKKAYREFRTKHWVISIIGFNYVPGLGIERGKVRKKYIFDLRKYKDIDAAIRDAIDRVSAFRKSHLSSYINGVVSLGAYKNLNTSLLSIYHGNGTSTIRTVIKGLSEFTGVNLTSNLTGRLPLVDLPVSITGEYYAPTAGNMVDFNFREEDKAARLERDVDLNFDKGV